ncbi:MAG: biopolymer transporter ExbD [Gemmatimonadota bacterium]|nr:biopolymer transporter ExbD [Gemmatimonadota bacterium]
MQFSTHQRRKPTINIVSLVDVVFLLLIFFSVSSTFMDQPALKIDLPEASAEPPETDEQDPMTVYLTGEGELYFGDRPVRLDDLPELIKKGISRKHSTRLEIKADRGVIHGRVIEVMDIARQNGIEIVTVATRKSGAENAP